MNLTRAFFAAFLALAAGCGNTIETGANGPGGGGGAGGSGNDPQCQACAAGWSKALGGTNWSTVRDIVSEANGNVVLLASLSGQIPGLGIETGDYGQSILAKLDPEGNVIWTRALPDVGFGRLAVNAAGHIFLAGGSDNVIVDLGGGSLGPAQDQRIVFVAELDENGNHLWSRTVASAPKVADGNAFVEPLALRLGPGGRLIVTGNFTGPLDFGNGDLDLPINPLAVKVFTAAFDASGDLLWSKRFGDQPSGNETLSDTGLFVSDTAMASDGSIWLGGQVFGVLHVGTTVLTSAGHADGFVARLDANGEPVFTRLFGGSEGDGILAIAIAPDGSLAFTGLATGTVDLGKGPTTGDAFSGTPFIASIDANGAVRWAHRPAPEDTTAIYGSHIGVAPGGNVVALLGENTATVSRMTLEGDTGAQLDLASFVPTVSDTTEPALSFDAFTLDPNGNPLVGGALRGSLDLGDGPITSQPEIWGTGAFIARMTQ